MDLDLDASTVDFRDEARAWLAEHVPAGPLGSFDTAEGFARHREWEALLAEARWSAVSWPREFGGRDASLLEWVLFEEEYHAAGAPGRVNQNGLFLLAPTLFAHGTDEQRHRILPKLASAERVWAQAWSEPGAGSDLAALRATATRDDGGWRLRGQKTWCSRAAFADNAFGLFRSDRDRPRHRGLTYFLVDLRADGVEVRPIAQLDGRPGFAEIFFDDVFVPDADVVGEVHRGWWVAMATAGHERGLTLRSPGRFLAAADRLVALWSASRDPALAARVADAWIGARAYQLHTLRTVTRAAGGGGHGPESSLTKLHWSRLDLALHETALDLLGPESEADRQWTDGWLFSLAGPIYGGTDQIQRNIVAERLLGLPRDDR